MTENLLLSPKDICDLTGRRRRNAQVRALRSMGIEHRVRPDGSVAILKAHIDKIFGGLDNLYAKQITEEPYLEELNA